MPTPADGSRQYPHHPDGGLDDAADVEKVDPRGCCICPPEFCVTKLPDYKAILPKWGYHPEIGALADEDFKGAAVPMRNCAGPAICWARASVVLTAVANLSLYFAATRSATCNPVTHFAVLPPMLFILLVPLGIVKLLLEWNTTKYLTIPYLQVVGHFGPPCLNIPFGIWALNMGIVSILQLLDNVTDTYFTARTLKSEQCSDHAFSHIWDHEIENSMFFHALPHYLYNFDTLIILLFCCLFFQQVIPLIEAMPQYQYWNQVQYNVGGPSLQGTDYHNFMGEPTTTGDAVCVLGEASGMGSLLQMGLFYPRAKEQYTRRLALAGQSQTMTQSLTGYGDGGVPKLDAHKALVYLQNAMIRGLARVGLVAMLENGLQLNMQVTVLALKRASLRGHDVPALTFAEISSVVLSLITAILKLNESRFILEFSHDVHVALDKHGRSLRAAASGVDYFPSDQSLPSADQQHGYAPARFEWMREDTLDLYRRVMRRWYLLIVCTFFMCGFVVYAVVKFCFVFICPYSLWNITGCVDLEAAVKSLPTRSVHT